MLVPVSWLADYLEPMPALPELIDALNTIGLKVETIRRSGGGFDGVTVGEVLKVAPHPKADKLVLVEVDSGSGPRSIVCGASNFKAGDKVPLALPGARLTGLDVEVATIRGQRSDGMLCSGKELGVSDDHEGILILDSDTDIGTDVRKVLDLGETVLDLEITPNRPDAMSLVGVAIDVAARLNIAAKGPVFEVNESGKATSEHASVVVEDPDGCPRYLARVVTGLEVGPSPDWVKERLTAAGLRPVSNVVDATNYALIATGHPMHAFDLDRLGGNKIIVRRARQGEVIETLDSEKRDLHPEDLVIADESVPVAIAGVMGGAGTEVSESTGAILLESAYFNPVSAMRTSQRHGLRTEASARFERGADPNAAELAASYAASLIAEWAGGKVSPVPIDIYSDPIEPLTVTARVDRVNSVLGTDFSVEEITEPLERLGLSPQVKANVITTTIPTRRPDITAEEDLIEEVARQLGYDRIPTTLLSGADRAGGRSESQKRTRELKWTLAGAGLLEAQSTSLIGPSDLDKFGYSPGHPVVKLANPLTADESVLRPSLLPGLLNTVVRNASRRVTEIRLFEIGHCFSPSDAELPNEEAKLGLVLYGEAPKEWHSQGRAFDYFDMKGIVELLAPPGSAEITFSPGVELPLHPTRSAAIHLGNKKIGELGEVAPDVADHYALDSRTIVCEIDVQPLLSAVTPTLEAELPVFPPVFLDLAVSVPVEVAAADLLGTAREIGGSLLESLSIFDVYEGEQTGEGRKSIALSLSFRRHDQTMTDAEAIEIRDAIASVLAERHGAEVRN